MEGKATQNTKHTIHIPTLHITVTEYELNKRTYGNESIKKEDDLVK